MKKTKPILLLALVFFAGVAVGVVGTRGVLRNMMHHWAKDPAAIRDRIEKDLVSRLDLTPEQQKQVHEIMMRSHEQLRQLRSEFGPRFMEITKKSEGDISALLTPEQQTKYKKMLEERKQLWRPPMPGKP